LNVKIVNWQIIGVWIYLLIQSCIVMMKNKVFGIYIYTSQSRQITGLNNAFLWTKCI